MAPVIFPILHTQHDHGPLRVGVLVAMFPVCSVDSLRKNIEFYHIIYMI